MKIKYVVMLCAGLACVESSQVSATEAGLSDVKMPFGTSWATPGFVWTIVGLGGGVPLLAWLNSKVAPLQKKKIELEKIEVTKRSPEQIKSLEAVTKQINKYLPLRVLAIILLGIGGGAAANTLVVGGLTDSSQKAVMTAQRFLRNYSLPRRLVDMRPRTVEGIAA